MTAEASIQRACWTDFFSVCHWLHGEVKDTCRSLAVESTGIWSVGTGLCGTSWCAL